MMEQESEVMESRLKNGYAELRSYGKSKRELRSEVQHVKDQEWVCELSAKQSAETEAAEVAGVRQRMRTQESMSCQKFEVCESRLRAEATAAHTLMTELEESQERLAEAMANQGMREKIPEDVTRLRQDLMQAQTALAGSQKEKNMADSLRRDLELAVGRLTRELHMKGEEATERARKDKKRRHDLEERINIVGNELSESRSSYSLNCVKVSETESEMKALRTRLNESVAREVKTKEEFAALVTQNEKAQDICSELLERNKRLLEKYRALKDEPREVPVALECDGKRWTFGEDSIMEYDEEGDLTWATVFPVDDQEVENDRRRTGSGERDKKPKTVKVERVSNPDPVAPSSNTGVMSASETVAATGVSNTGRAKSSGAASSSQGHDAVKHDTSKGKKDKPVKKEDKVKKEESDEEEKGKRSSDSDSSDSSSSSSSDSSDPSDDPSGDSEEQRRKKKKKKKKKKKDKKRDMRELPR